MARAAAHRGGAFGPFLLLVGDGVGRGGAAGQGMPEGGGVGPEGAGVVARQRHPALSHRHGWMASLVRTLGGPRAPAGARAAASIAASVAASAAAARASSQPCGGLWPSCRSSGSAGGHRSSTPKLSRVARHSSGDVRPSAAPRPGAGGM